MTAQGWPEAPGRCFSLLSGGAAAHPLGPAHLVSFLACTARVCKGPHSSCRLPRLPASH